MHATTIVGWTNGTGCIYCADCEPEDCDEKAPIYADGSDWQSDTCDSCEEPLDPDYTPDEASDEPLEPNDAISHGFSAGNYANAYETQNYGQSMARLSRKRSPDYRAAYTLGFFSSYEPHEMGSDEESFDEAYALVGARAIALGIAVERDEERDDETE